MLALNVLILALAVSTSYACECGVSNAPRVYMGWETEPNKYPWMAHLRFNMPGKPGAFFQCGGSIIDKRTILTAGHCVHDQKTGLVTPSRLANVFLGIHRKFEANEGSQNHYGVERIITDPRYTVKEALDYDIAILKLDRDIVFTKKVSPICLPADDSRPFNRLVVSGWGSLDAKGSRAYSLREVELDYLNRQTCTEYKTHYYAALSQALGYRMRPSPIHHHHICALDVKTRGDACAGDSGGPLMYRDSNRRHFAVGIVSGAWNDCSTPLTPGLYTSVADFRDMIRKYAPGSCFRQYDR